MSNGCWFWTGQSRNGYGLYWANGRQYQAHRYVYEIKKKKIEDGKHLDHLCRNKACVNPEHMEEVTNKINCQRGNQAVINQEIANLIREEYKINKTRYVDIGIKYNISIATVSQIIRGVTW